MERKAAPILKWAGGKRQLLTELLARVPESFKAYHEFFFGGGALFFELYNQGRIKKAYLSDLNPKLINVYKVVKERPEELMEELKSPKYKNEAKAFYEIRALKPEDAVEQAAGFIYLNKTAYNGLYRENAKGEFNVPFGKYKNPRILDEEGILAASEAFSMAELLCGDFSRISKYGKAKDFAYFDPPYHPLSKTASFTAYTSEVFGPEEQKRLRRIYDQLKRKRVKVLLSNSCTDYIKELYADERADIVPAKRIICCKVAGRGPVNEILVMGGY